jgi:RecA/RadA recombinase
MSLIGKLSKNKKIQEFIYKDEQTPKDFINTGCLSLNILFSGKLDGGIPVGKVNQIAAPSSLGKSFIGMKVAKNAQKKGMEVVYLDSEFAYDPVFAENVGINTDKILVIQDNQIESLLQTVMQIANDLEKEERAKILLVIDSWGGLVTSKTVEDATIGKDVSDMTVSKKKNSFARLLTGLGFTVFVINQVYDCGTENVTVMTSNGSVSLKDILVGDSVMTTEGWQTVQNKFEYTDAITYDIEMEDGSIMSFTEGHKFLVSREGKDIWVPVGDLVPDDDILLYDDTKLYTLS